MAVEAAPPRENVASRTVTFYNDVMAEMRKVTWPDLGQVRQSTLLIIVFVLFVGLVIYLMDLGLQGILVRLIPSLFGAR